MSSCMAAKGSGEPPPRKTLYLALRILFYKLAVVPLAPTASILPLFQVQKNPQIVKIKKKIKKGTLLVIKLCIRFNIISIKKEVMWAILRYASRWWGDTAVQNLVWNPLSFLLSVILGERFYVTALCKCALYCTMTFPGLYCPRALVIDYLI